MNVRECEHGLPYGICMKDECVHKFMDGRLAGFENKIHTEIVSLEEMEEKYGSNADMDTILAHECQHGSDMRVCQKCALIDQVIRTQPFAAGVTVDEWLETFDKLDHGLDK